MLVAIRERAWRHAEIDSGEKDGRAIVLFIFIMLDDAG